MGSVLPRHQNNPRRAMEQIVEYKNEPGNGDTCTLVCFVQLFVARHRATVVLFKTTTYFGSTRLYCLGRAFF